MGEWRRGTWNTGESIMRKILCFFLVCYRRLISSIFSQFECLRGKKRYKKNTVLENAGFSRVIGSSKREEKNRTKSANSEKKVARNRFENNEIIKSGKTPAEKILVKKDQWEFSLTIFTSQRRFFLTSSITFHRSD